MALAQPCPDLGQVTDRQPGPNQWLKDHLDSVIDAELLRDGPDAHATAGEEGLGR